MQLSSFLSHLSWPPQRSRRSRRECRFAEQMEDRRLLSATNDLASLSDEFDDGATQSAWQRVHEVENWNADQLQTYDIDQTQPGRMVMMPQTVVWYQDWRGPMAFKEVTGDFVFTTQVVISDRDDVGDSDADDIPDDAQFSLGGAMIRTPRNISDPSTDWQPGSMADDGTNQGENYVFLSLGHGTNGDYTFEVKETRNSDSQLELTPTTGHTATVQIARIGSAVLTLIQRPGEDWIVHRRFNRPDLPATLQAGIVSYTDWGKASDFTPFDHNGRVLDGTGPDPTPGEAYNPDLTAGYEYARFFRPQLPTELEGVDLVDSASDEQLLAFLGEHANQPGGDGEDGLPTVTVSALAAGASESAGDVDIFVVTRSGASVEEPLTVQLVWGGDADAGEDYAVLPTEVVIPAGASGVTMNLQPVDDMVIEGAEQVELSLVDSLFYEIGSVPAAMEIYDDDYEFPADDAIGTLQPDWQTDLVLQHPDGRDLLWSVSEVTSPEHTLDQVYDFHSDGNYHDNWMGASERWVRGAAGGWFYLLPDGAMHEWQDSAASSPLIGMLGVAAYQDPQRLIDVPEPATAVVDGGALIVDPADHYVGEVWVGLQVTNGWTSAYRRMNLTVLHETNQPPDLTVPDELSAARNTTEILAPYSAVDPDGHAVTISAEVIETLEYRLDQQYVFAETENYHDNWGGLDERWLRSEADAFSWFYLLPSGGLYQWGGSFADSAEIAVLDVQVYEDPALLTAPAPLPIQIELGDTDLRILPQLGYAGEFTIVVTADDGQDVAEATLAVTIHNSAPQLTPIGDRMWDTDSGSLQIPLEAEDAEGDALQWSVQVRQSQAYELDQLYGFESADNFHTNWGGRNEKWIRNAGGDWFFLLDDGGLYQWEGDFDSSLLLAELGTEYYTDPNRLADPEEVAVSAEIISGTLSLTAHGDLPDTLELWVGVSDGLETASEEIVVSIL